MRDGATENFKSWSMLLSYLYVVMVVHFVITIAFRNGRMVLLIPFVNCKVLSPMRMNVNFPSIHIPYYIVIIIIFILLKDCK